MGFRPSGEVRLVSPLVLCWVNEWANDELPQGRVISSGPVLDVAEATLSLVFQRVELALKTTKQTANYCLPCIGNDSCGTYKKISGVANRGFTENCIATALVGPAQLMSSNPVVAALKRFALHTRRQFGRRHKRQLFSSLVGNNRHH